MAWALVQSGNAKRAVTKVMCSLQTPPMRAGLHGGGNSLRNICSKQSGNTKRAVIKVMCSSLQTPGLRGGINSLCNMVNNRSHDFHSTAAEKVCPILPQGEDMFESFTDTANEVIKFAQKETRRFGHKFVGTEMILLGLIGNDIDTILGEGTDIAKKVLYSMDIFLDGARLEVQEIFGCGGPSLSGDIPFRPSAFRAFQLSLAEAQQLGHNYIGSEHLLLGLLAEDGAANHVLRELGACPINIHTQVMGMIEENAAEAVGDGSSGNEMPTLEAEYGLNLTDEKKLDDPVVQGPTQRIADFVINGSSVDRMPMLEEKLYGDKDGHNLTELVYKGELPRVVERKSLLNTVIQILGRRSKNNPCLVGEKGVGKTTLVQGLAQRIVDFDVPDFLSNKEVITLTEHIYFGYNLTQLLEEIKECNGVILFIDELDKLADPQIDLAFDILMPAVARGEVQCVIAATPDEYLSIKKYPALQTLFQPIKVPEATVDETIEILKVHKDILGQRHKVRYTDEALVSAALMSDQTIWDAFLPRKAIDVINLAGPIVFTKEIHQARDQEMGHRWLRPNVTKADIEDVVSDMSHLSSSMYRLFGEDRSYQDCFDPHYP